MLSVAQVSYDQNGADGEHGKCVDHIKHSGIEHGLMTEDGCHDGIAHEPHIAEHQRKTHNPFVFFLPSEITGQ